MDSLKIQIPSLVENIRIVESFIENIKDKFNIDDDIYGNIMVAVTESVNNAINHGNKLDKQKNVTLVFTQNNSDITFSISDEGPGFNYFDLPDPTAPENLLKPGGRGIFLMKNLSDEVNFTDGGKTVELVFYIS